MENHNTSRTDLWQLTQRQIKFRKAKAMKITVEFINHKGFWRVFTVKSKKLLLETINALAQGTSVKWLSKNRVHISQQYCTRVVRGEVCQQGLS